MSKRRDEFLNDCSWLFKKDIAHRGVYDNKKIYENTLEAYKEAIKEKKAIELDVCLSLDRQVICIHDSNLKRLFNRDREVKDISVKRLNKLRDDLYVPTLKEVLDLVDGKVELMIELKSVNSKLNKMLVKEVNKLLSEYKGKYVIVSFNPILLYKYHRVNKKAYLGRISSLNITGNKFVRYVVRGIKLNLVKPDFISMDAYNYDSDLINKYKKKGYKVVCWPLKNKDEKKDFKKVFDGFIVDYK